MPRRPLDPTRGILEIDWPLFGELCRALALKVARSYDPEIILGVAKAGVIPGAVVASILEREFSSMTVTRKKAGAMPVVVSGPPATIRGRRVLIVGILNHRDPAQMLSALRADEYNVVLCCTAPSPRGLPGAALAGVLALMGSGGCRRCGRGLRTGPRSALSRDRKSVV